MPYLRPKTFLNLPPKLQPVVYTVPCPAIPRTTDRRGLQDSQERSADGRAPRCTTANHLCGRGPSGPDTAQSFRSPTGRQNFWVNETNRGSTLMSSQLQQSTTPSRNHCHSNVPYHRPPDKTSMVGLQRQNPENQTLGNNAAFKVLAKTVNKGPSSSAPYSRSIQQAGMFNEDANGRTIFPGEGSTCQALRLPRALGQVGAEGPSSVPTPQVLNPVIEELVYEDGYPRPGSDVGGLWPPAKMELFYLPQEDHLGSETKNIRIITSAKHHKTFNVVQK